MRLMTTFFKDVNFLVPGSVKKDICQVWMRKTKKTSNPTKAKTGKEGEQSSDNGDSKGSVTLNDFYRIFQNQEQPQSQIDNRSQFSEFSLKLNHSRRMSEDFFDF